MTIDRGTVQHIARLAELAVTDEEADLLAGQLERIVTFVEQLGTLDAAGDADASVVIGPERTPLREDIVAPIPMAHPPEAMAPAMQDGLFLVPRLGGMAAE
jgi:aspartyl-tRNA(Asn)/glutamyl-tRNA(Gln) amidotransferase subunit C